MTDNKEQQIAYLKSRVAELEEQLSKNRQRYAFSANKNDQYASLIDRLCDDLESVVKSMRWRVGDRFCGVMEKVLLRPQPELLINQMRSALAKARENKVSGWKLQSHRPHHGMTKQSGEPLVGKIAAAPKPADTQFYSWLQQSTLSSADLDRVNRSLEQEQQDIERLLTQTCWPGPLPLVSIVMPTYNRAGVIVQAVTSVIQQRYQNWELLICDDGSDDNTQDLIQSLNDARVQFLKLPHKGAAAARNAGLASAAGDIIAYLDSDNLWRPDYLAAMVASLINDQSQYCAYSAYFDLIIGANATRIKSAQVKTFTYRSLSTKNFVDLNSFVHWRSLYDVFGGFTESLERQQDWDLVLKYTFLRDPILVDLRLTLYRRNEQWNQLTALKATTAERTRSIIQANVESYYESGLPMRDSSEHRPKITVLIWDVCRNHFSKAYNIAEALSDSYNVQLIGFRFFEEPIFPPYEDVKPKFEMHVFDGCDFPNFFAVMTKALAKIDGDFIYCVKPRLPSLGLALLANFHRGTPFALECNDLESVVSSPGKEQLSDTTVLDFNDDTLLSPYSQAWTKHLEGLAKTLPLKVTHNRNLDHWLGGNCHFIRNIKDETAFDPNRVNRDLTRNELGFEEHHYVLLFSGLVRRHKGIFDVQSLVENGPPHLRLLVVGSRTTPDLKKLSKSEKVVILPPQDRNTIAKYTAAADGVVLWLDPGIPASHYQMPFKLTDALALNLQIFANRISDLEELIDQEEITEVPFGDASALLEAVSRTPKRGNHRDLYLRQFSYASARASVALLLQRARDFPQELGPAAEFANTFDQFVNRNSP